MIRKNIKHIPEFKTFEEVDAWMFECVDTEEMDFFRFAYIDDVEEMKEYERIRKSGTGASFDEEVYINNDLATIGCHYERGE